MNKMVIVKFTSTCVTATCPKCGGKGIVIENGEEIVCS